MWYGKTLNAQRELSSPGNCSRKTPPIISRRKALEIVFMKCWCGWCCILWLQTVLCEGQWAREVEEGDDEKEEDESRELWCFNTISVQLDVNFIYVNIEESLIINSFYYFIWSARAAHNHLLCQAALAAGSERWNDDEIQQSHLISFFYPRSFYGPSECLSIYFHLWIYSWSSSSRLSATAPNSPVHFDPIV